MMYKSVSYVSEFSEPVLDFRIQYTNIIKEVLNGSRFVYKYVAYPLIWRSDFKSYDSYCSR